MGPVGWQEMMVIFIVALVLFGPKKLPELGRTLGKAITEFRRASNELKATFEREMQTLERENESLKEVTRNFTSDVTSQISPGYDSPYDYGAYGSESYDSTATNPTTVSASATEDADKKSELPALNGTVAVPGTVARGAAEPAAYATGTEYSSGPFGPLNGEPGSPATHTSDTGVHHS
jgi:sec-independent protein translocase protein TatA